MGIALIAQAFFTLSNARLNFLPIRAHSTTNFKNFYRPDFNPAHLMADSFFLRPLLVTSNVERTNPLNKGQFRHKSWPLSSLNSQRGKSLPFPRNF
jgi:hypothetical protein